MVGTQDLKKPLLLLVAFLPLMTFAQSLRTNLDALLRDPLFRTTDVALAVYDLTADTLLYSHREAKRMRPASTQKIITTVTALALLGPDYTYRTTLRLDSLGTADTADTSEPLARAIPYYTIKGDLDPLFTEADLDSLLLGLPDEHVLHTDLTLMDAPYWGPGWSWDDAPYAFQPRLSALMIDEGCVTVTVRPTAKDSLAAVTVTPASGYYTVVNRTRSKQPAAGPFTLRQNWMQDGRTLVLEGNVEKTIQKIVPMNSEAFTQSLIEERTNSCRDARSCVRSNTAIHSQETPITQVLTRALKKSDNLCAEALYFHLTPCDRRPATWESSAEAVQTFARDTLHLTKVEVDVHDGSGVSLYDYTTAQALLTYLCYAHRRSWFPTFYDALPVAGEDGTLVARMRGSRAAGNVHAKTGSVTGVSTLAGYVTAANGHLLAFVVMNQGVVRLADARRWQDKVCETMAK